VRLGTRFRRIFHQWRGKATDFFPVRPPLGATRCLLGGGKWRRLPCSGGPPGTTSIHRDPKGDERGVFRRLRAERRDVRRQGQSHLLFPATKAATTRVFGRPTAADTVLPAASGDGPAEDGPTAGKTKLRCFRWATVPGTNGLPRRRPVPNDKQWDAGCGPTDLMMGGAGQRHDLNVRRPRARTGSSSNGGDLFNTKTRSGGEGNDPLRLGRRRQPTHRRLPGRRSVVGPGTATNLIRGGTPGNDHIWGRRLAANTIQGGGLANDMIRWRFGQTAS